MAPPTTDVGVDLEAGTIQVGLLSDLSGPFAGLVSAIVAGQEGYWAYVNANGGIEGLQVELVVEDTGYDVPQHVTLYEQLKDQVVAIGHSTGSPHTVAIYEDLVADEILAIPLTWYSGWTAPFDSNTMHHGSPYCIEAMNSIDYIKNDTELPRLRSHRFLVTTDSIRPPVLRSLRRRSGSRSSTATLAGSFQARIWHQ